MDQLTQIMKVTGVPGPEFVQKLDTQEVGHNTVCRKCTCASQNYSLTEVAFKSLIPIDDIQLKSWLNKWINAKGSVISQRVHSENASSLLNHLERNTLNQPCPDYSTKGRRGCRFSFQPSSSTPDLTHLINWSQSSESWLVKLCALDWLEQKTCSHTALCGIVWICLL